MTTPVGGKKRRRTFGVRDDKVHLLGGRREEHEGARELVAEEVGLRLCEDGVSVRPIPHRCSPVRLTRSSRLLLTHPFPARGASPGRRSKEIEREPTWMELPLRYGFSSSELPATMMRCSRSPSGAASSSFVCSRQDPTLARASFGSRGTGRRMDAPPSLRRGGTRGDGRSQRR